MSLTVGIPDKEDEEEDEEDEEDEEEDEDGNNEVSAMVSKEEDATQHNYRPFKAAGPCIKCIGQTGPDFAPNRAGCHSGQCYCRIFLPPSPSLAISTLAIILIV